MKHWADLALACVAWALLTSFLWSSRDFNTDTTPRPGVLVKRLHNNGAVRSHNGSGHSKAAASA